MFGSLLYLATNRTDIAFSVGVCARFQLDHKESSQVLRDISFDMLMAL